jgi:hypothetical protein
MPISEGFLAMVVASGMTLVGALLALLYKSKCTRIRCCGIEIDRDVAGEEKLDEEELRHRNDVAIGV